MNEIAECTVILFICYILLRHWTEDVRQSGILAFVGTMSAIATMGLGDNYVFLGLGVAITSMLCFFLDVLELKRVGEWK